MDQVRRYLGTLLLCRLTCIKSSPIERSAHAGIRRSLQQANQLPGASFAISSPSPPAPTPPSRGAAASNSAVPVPTNPAGEIMDHVSPLDEQTA